jgi:hypothetical protein
MGPELRAGDGKGSSFTRYLGRGADMMDLGIVPASLLQGPCARRVFHSYRKLLTKAKLVFRAHHRGVVAFE